MVDWDDFNYKTVVREAKRAGGELESEIMRSLEKHLVTQYGKVVFNRTASQKETSIVMD